MKTRIFKFIKEHRFSFLFLGTMISALTIATVFSFFDHKEEDPSIAKTINKCYLQDSLDIKKIQFEEHTYIYLINRFNYAGNSFIHDPGCICQKK